MRIEQVRRRLALVDADGLSNGWGYAALWVPAGYASTKIYGAATPTVAIAFGATAVALVHRFFPGPVEAVAGVAGLFTAVLAAAHGDCHELVGNDGVAVLMVFGGGMCSWAVVRVLGSASLREAARYVLVAVVSLELALSVVTPIDEAVHGFRASTSTAAVLAVLLLALTLTGVHASKGLVWLGVALVGVEAVLAVTGGPCHDEAVRALVGTVVFAAVAAYLAPDSPWRPPEPEDQSRGEGNQGRWAGDYEGRGPAPDPEPADDWPGDAAIGPGDEVSGDDWPGDD
jgi:hypothetical protein